MQPNPHEAVPAHLRVRHYILRLIESEGSDVGSRIPSENEIATVLGVSRMTANKAIQALVREGWLSREQGSGTFVARIPSDLALDRCVIYTGTPVDYSMSDYYFGGLVGTIRGRMAALGIPVELGDGCSRKRVDERHGYIEINPQPGEGSALRFLAENGIPVVALGATLPDIADLCVDSDNVLGGLLAGQHLLDNGHEVNAFVGAFASNPNTRDRLRGFRLAGKARGIACCPDRELVLNEDLNLTTEQEELFIRLLSNPETTGVFAAGPRLALQVLLIARRLGRAVPDDLSIVAYDDPDFVQLATPPLTTVRQPLAAMANLACDRLLGVATSSVCLDPELVVRGSVVRLQNTG